MAGDPAARPTWVRANERLKDRLKPAEPSRDLDEFRAPTPNAVARDEVVAVEQPLVTGFTPLMLGLDDVLEQQQHHDHDARDAEHDEDQKEFIPSHGRLE
jgi:hypothetical protein